jgi:hypothetical protein
MAEADMIKTEQDVKTAIVEHPATEATGTKVKPGIEPLDEKALESVAGGDGGVFGFTGFCPTISGAP